MRIISSVLLTIVLFGCSARLEQAAPIPTSEPEVGYAVVDVATGKLIASKAANTGFMPASTAKVVTAISALAILPEDHRFVTRVCTSDQTDAGYDESLVLIGGGDPLLPLPQMLQMVSDLALAWTSQAEQRISLQYDDGPVLTMGVISSRQPPLAVYNPSLSGLMLAESAIRNTQLLQGTGGRIPWSPNPVPEGAGEWYPATSPSRHAAETFADYAARLGVRLEVSETKGRCVVELVRHESQSRDHVIAEVLTLSSNPGAELLGLAADTVRTGSSSDKITDAAERTEAWLSTRFPGLDWKDFNLQNHSGLSTASRITPAQMAELIATAFKDQDIDFTPSLLTPSGWAGHLRNRLMTAGTGGAIWAKTGTMNYGVGLAGFMLSKKTSLRSFAIYVTDRDARIDYDKLGRFPSDDVEREAKAWNARARRLIDEQVERWMSLGQ